MIRGALLVSMVDLILAKRAGQEHQREDIERLVSGIMDESIPDYQLSAWLMAVCWQGLSVDETAWLTDAMCRSGEVLDLSSVGKYVGDKHSTGGVGDKTTLVFVPLMASMGIPMAKLSGRGLGHTGGTIDKLEAIPGFNCSLSKEAFITQVKEKGMAVAGQTAQLAPADGKMYALRDVTGTVASIPLIAASVMSKKLAAGSTFIILDVKCGRGAFMETEAQAVELARLMVEVGKRLGKPVVAVVTDMEQPLGNAVGHSVEVEEAVETLKGNGPCDLEELCLSLGAEALVAAERYEDREEARRSLKEALASGKALAGFRTLIEAQGGDSGIIEDYALMPQAQESFELLYEAKDSAWVEHLDGRTVAEALKRLGAGRARKGDPIDLAVGVVLCAKVGSRLEPGQSLLKLKAHNREQFDEIKALLYSAYRFSTTEVATPPLVKACIS